jgi:phosphoglycolate phosphatase
MNRSEVTHIIFDLDGTLIDSSQGIIDAVNYSLRSVGVQERKADEITPYIGYPLKQMYTDFTDVSYQDLYTHFQHHATTSVVDAAVALNGVDDVLNELHSKGYRLGIATNKIAFHITAIVNKLGWTDLFSATAGGDEVTHQKPHPEMIYLTMNRMKATPQTTLMVGDTDNDILAARRAGIRSATVPSPYMHTRPDNADFHINHISDLWQCIEQ